MNWVRFGNHTSGPWEAYKLLDTHEWQVRGGSGFVKQNVARGGKLADASIIACAPEMLGYLATMVCNAGTMIVAGTIPGVTQRSFSADAAALTALALGRHARAELRAYMAFAGQHSRNEQAYTEVQVALIKAEYFDLLPFAPIRDDNE